MKHIITIPYSETDFLWISNHWDLHLEGLCKYKNKIHKFKTLEGEWNEDLNDWNESFCEIYKLNFIEKINLLWIKKKFEWFVGYHWTYPHRKNGYSFHYRKPKFIFVWLFNLYYKRKNNKIK